MDVEKGGRTKTKWKPASSDFYFLNMRRDHKGRKEEGNHEKKI